MPDIVDTSPLEANGTPVELRGTYFGLDSYFKVLDTWECGAFYGFYVDQTCTSLLNFTEVYFSIHCIPGLPPNWRICRGTMLDDNRVPIGSIGDETCESPPLSIDIIGGDEEGMLPIYRLFTGTLTGSRVQSGGEEEDVSVRFDFPPGSIPTIREFRSLLFRHMGTHPPDSWITMLETRGGAEYTYDFRWNEFSAELWSIEDREHRGDTPLHRGRLVYDPPRLMLHFDGLDYVLTAG